MRTLSDHYKLCGPHGALPTARSAGRESASPVHGLLSASPARRHLRSRPSGRGRHSWTGLETNHSPTQGREPEAELLSRRRARGRAEMAATVKQGFIYMGKPWKEGKRGEGKNRLL